MKEETTRYYRTELKKLKQEIEVLKAKISVYNTIFYYLGGNAK